MFSRLPRNSTGKTSRIAQAPASGSHAGSACSTKAPTLLGGAHSNVSEHRSMAIDGIRSPK